MLREINDGYVKTERHDAVTTIEFFHPQSNSLPGRLLEAITHEVHGAGNDTHSRVIVLRSAGEKAFCAGASFDELLAVQNADQGFQFFSGFAHLINAMRKCPQFVIVRVQGKCVGGGVGIAAAADYAIAAEGADVKLGVPHLKGGKVSATVLRHGKGTKVSIVKFRRRKHYLRQKGHRQLFTEVKVTAISAG